MRDATVATVMTRDVVSIRPDTGVKEIVELLADKRISAVPVLDPAGELVGVVSEADLLAKPEFRGGVDRPRLTARRERAAWRKSGALSAVEVMTRAPLTIRDSDPIPAAARRLAETGVRRLFVVDESGKLVGVLARRDLLTVFLRPDERIGAEVLREVFGRVLWADTSRISVDVTDGFVTLLGTVERRSEVDLAGRLVRAMPGVVGVRNALQYDLDDSTVKAPRA